MSSQMESSAGDSVSSLLGHLKNGRQDAGQKIWSRYMERLAAEARRKLRATSCRVADEDDVANRAFNSFLTGVREGRFSRLNDRSDLWQVLVTLVDRTAKDQIRTLNAQKRGSGQTRGDSVCLDPTGELMHLGFEGVADPQPTPEFVETFCDLFRKLMALIDDPVCQQVADLKLQNFANKEIAEKLGIGEATVERKLARIRATWNKLDQD